MEEFFKQVLVHLRLCKCLPLDPPDSSVETINDCDELIEFTEEILGINEKQE